ncbi:MAG: hypothetical protein L0I76_29375 [Pseudonocardia sp.]|nr:hypothetical protein [Pseudonocardia sp.]
MSVSAADDSDLEFVVSPGLAAAARREGVELPEGARVRLHVVPDAEVVASRRRLPWIGAVTTGVTGRSATYRETLRAEMGRSAE